MTEGGGDWQPVYRTAMLVLLDRLFDELETRAAEATRWSGLSPSAWSRYVRGKHFPRSLTEVALGLGIDPLDLERALVVTCAELLGLGYVDAGRDEREENEVDRQLVYWRVLEDLLQELHCKLRVTQTQCAARAGLSVGAWSRYVRGGSSPVANLPKIARGFGITVDELERRIVSRCLEAVGLSTASRVLSPGPCWAFGAALLDDGRVLVADTLRAELWEYDRRGAGRKVEPVAAAVPGVNRVERAPEGATWLLGRGTFLELSDRLEPLRSYAVWGRRDAAGRLLEGLHQWTLIDHETVAAVGHGENQVWAIRLILTAAEAGRFEVIEPLEPRPLEPRYWREGTPKIAAAGGEVHLARVARDAIEVWRLGSGELVAAYPGGAEVMRATGETVGDWHAGLSVLGLVAVDNEVLAWRRHGREHWLEDLHGRRRSKARKSRALRLVPVVGAGTPGMLELVGEVGGSRDAALLWLEGLQDQECGGGCDEDI